MKSDFFLTHNFCMYKKPSCINIKKAYYKFIHSNHFQSVFSEKIT